MQPKSRMTFRFDSPKPAERLPAAFPKPAAARPMTEPQPAPAQDGQAARSGRKDESPTQAYYDGSPLQDDLYTLEEMIRQSGPVRLAVPAVETPAAEAADEPPLLTDIDPPWSSFVAGGSGGDGAVQSGWFPSIGSRRDGPSWWRVFASVAGAVATGALFGYLVLTLFTGTTPIPASPSSSTDTPAQAPADAARPEPSLPAADAPGNGKSGSAAQPAAAVAESSFYLLQYGVFRTEESMNAAVRELKKQGMPSAVDRTDGFRVYAGAAETKEEAERLAARFPGIEVYVKPASGAAVEASTGAEWTSFVELSGKMIRMLTRLSADALDGESQRPLDADALASIRETYRVWRQSAAGMHTRSGPALEPAKALELALNAAMTAADDYTRQKSKALLTGIQSHVTQAILADRTLRSELQQP